VIKAEINPNQLIRLSPDGLLAPMRQNQKALEAAKVFS
jgi:hypothetical protein